MLPVLAADVKYVGADVRLAKYTIAATTNATATINACIPRERNGEFLRPSVAMET